MFLNPAVVLGCIVVVESGSFGKFSLKVNELRHEGDNREGAFETVAQGEAL